MPGACPCSRGLTTHLGLLFGIVAAIILWIVIFRSRWGYEIRLIGDNPRAARYAGINITRNTVLVMMVSGALAGLGGMSEVTGVVHRLQTSPLAAGYGFTGIIVAWLAKLNPLVIIVVSVLFGALILAGREIQPSGVPKMIQGIILVCLIASDFFLRYRIRIVRGGRGGLADEFHRHPAGRRRQRNGAAVCHARRGAGGALGRAEPGRGRHDADRRDERLQRRCQTRQSMAGRCWWRCCWPGC